MKILFVIRISMSNKYTIHTNAIPIFGIILIIYLTDSIIIIRDHRDNIYTLVYIIYDISTIPRNESIPHSPHPDIQQHGDD